jgi:hypothetical protein
MDVIKFVLSTVPRFLYGRNQFDNKIRPQHRAPFSFFALPDSFSTVPRASGLVLMFNAPVFVLGCTDGAGSRFHFLRSGTRFRLYRGRRFPFSCLAIADSFWTVPMASGPIFMFCASGLVFDVIEGVGFPFHVWRS